MNPTDHEQAQRWLQARLDQSLSPTEGEALDAHLKDCPACRRYAAQIEKLDTGLRRHFRQTAASRSSARTADYVSNRVRANMSAKRMWNFAGSVALLLGLLAVMAGLAFLTERTISAGQELTATPLPTATSLPPTPTPQPLNTVDEIAAVLERLAGENLKFLQRPGWVRTQSFNAAEDAASMAYYSEIWRHYPQSDGACTQSLAITRASPGSAGLIQLMVWSEGAFGDLLSLRKGQGQVQTVTAANMDCVAAIDQTPAGELALRLLGKSTAPRKDAGKDLQTVEARYGSIEGHPAVMVVKAKFRNDQSVPPLQVEQYSFDLENGLLLRQEIAMQNKDGSPFSDMRLRIQTDFYTELPAETAQIFQQAAAELAAFQSGETAGLVAPTATPAPGALTGLPTTPESALTDVEEIVAVLRALRERQLGWLSRPGWYVYENPIPITTASWTMSYATLIHSTGEGRCELMTYFRKPGQVLPQQIQLADGTWGLIGTVESGVFTEGKAQEAPCTLDKLESVSLLDQQIVGLPEQVQKQQTQIRAWVGKSADLTYEDVTVRGRAVLAVVSDTTYTDPKPRAMDPDTRKLEALDRNIEWNLYDLETGAPLGVGTQFHLSNGKILGELPDWSAPLTATTPLSLYTYVETPPADLAEAFEKATQDLKAYLGLASVPARGLVVFAASPTQGSADVYTMKPDGSSLTNLTQHAARDFSPVWSPDGKQIAFLSNRTGSQEVFLMSVDGSGLRQLTKTPFRSQYDAQTGTNSYPDYRSLSWSPDGAFLLAELSLGPGTGSENRLALIRADGNGAQYFEGGPFLGPCWSPDGARIAFVTYGSRGLAIRVWDAGMLAKESRVKEIGAADTPDWQETGALRWSRDSKTLAYIALSQELQAHSLRVTSVDVVTQKSIYTFAEDVTAAFTAPVWTPDGRTLVFAGQGKILIANADGSGTKQLAEWTEPVTGLALSPDGRYLLFSAGSPDSQVYSLDLAAALSDPTSTRPVQLTRDPSLSAYSPAWQPGT